MKEKYYIILALIFLVCLPAFKIDAAENFGSISVYNARAGDTFTLIQTHTVGENFEFIKLDEPIVIEKNSNKSNFPNLRLGIYELTLGNSFETYKLELPDFKDPNSYDRKIFLKRGEISVEKLIGTTENKLSHHHINDELIISNKENFYYGIKLNMPKEYDKNHYHGITIEDSYPSMLIINESSIKVELSNGTVLEDGVDYVKSNDEKLRISLTKLGLDKVKPGSSLYIKFQVSIKPNEQGNVFLNIPNSAVVHYHFNGVAHKIESESDYFSSKTKIICIKKVDDMTLKPLEGAKFSLTFEGNRIGTSISNRDGEAFFTVLNSGDYKITEEESPKNYAKLNYSIDVSVSDSENEVEIIVKNKKRNIKLPETGERASKLPYFGILILFMFILFYKRRVYYENNS